MKDSTIKNRLLKIVSIVCFLLVWKIASIMVNSSIILPSPEETLQRLIHIVNGLNFWKHIAATVTRGLIGFIISLAVGLVVGLLAGFNKTASILLQPLIITCRSTPVMSIILLALIWFKTDNVPIFVTFLISFPIICGNVIEGIKNIDKNLVEMAQSYNVKKWRILYEVHLPSIVPYLVAGISTAMGLGWKVVVAAEVLSQPKYAVGTKLYLEKLYFETAGVFAWTIIALMLSYLFEKAFRMLEKKLIDWR